MQKLVIVRDWIISADDDSNAFDFRMPSSVFLITFTCSYSLITDNCLTFSLMCLAVSRDILNLLTELIIFTDWCSNKGYRCKYSFNKLNEICAELHPL